MRSEAIRVKKPVWVRLVNPDPIHILDMSWEYGSYARVAEGSVFHPLFHTRLRTLAMIQSPSAPCGQDDAPSNAMVFYTPMELRLLAEGTMSDGEPFEKPVPRWSNAPAKVVRIGDRACVPFSRMVRAAPTLEVPDLVAYRGSMRADYRNGRLESYPIRPGGTMTAIAVPGDEARLLVKVLYRANRGYRGNQCPSGHWFDLPESEFLRMKKLAEDLREQEGLEIAVIVSLLRSL